MKDREVDLLTAETAVRGVERSPALQDRLRAVLVSPVESEGSRDGSGVLMQRALDLLVEMIETQGVKACVLDHHGYCRTHIGGVRDGDDGYPECWVVAASRVVYPIDDV